MIVSKAATDAYREGWDRTFDGSSEFFLSSFFEAFEKPCPQGYIQGHDPGGDITDAVVNGQKSKKNHLR